MSKLFTSKLLLAVAMAFVPTIVSAQIDPDLPITATATCFSICLQSQNVQGVSGDITIKDLSASTTANMSATIKVQCNGTDVVGATQTDAGSVAALATGTFPYSIAFTPVAGCAYTIVITATSDLLPPGRSSILATPFVADCLPQPCGITGCTLTQGFWKNHAEDWAVTSLTLGTVTYTQAQLLAILNQPVKGNGLVSLAHQLIAAKLNVANGATCNTVVKLISDADKIIGALVVPPVGSGSLSTSSVGTLVTGLDNFNNGLLANCPGHCAE
jgi:hypothetical protein